MRRSNAARMIALAVGLGGAIASANAHADTVPAAAPSTMGTRTTSLSDAIAVALRQNPDALTSEAQVREAEGTRSGTKGDYFPKVHIDANAQEYNSPFSIPFSLGSGPAAQFPVRDQFTWTFSPSLIQPLTALWAIYDQYKIASYGVDVAALKRRSTRREIAFQVAQGYYRLLEAERLSQVAETSVTQLEAQQKEAQSLFDNGVIGKNDLLRAGLALASARQRVIQVHGSVTLARGQLNIAMGNLPDAPFEPVAVAGEPPAVQDGSIQAAESRAVAQRLELSVIDRSVAQADHNVAFAKKKYLPQINAVANYTHLGGQKLAEEDAEYIGLVASWDVWDWGTTTGGVDVANAKLEEARIARKKVEDQVRIEAREAFVNAETAREALGVARTAVEQAEENYRIVSKKFEANAATSFDVVDAESLLTQARGQVETGLYDYLIARAALERATGTPLPGEQ
jgi:outer membrane protein TolC